MPNVAPANNVSPPLSVINVQIEQKKLGEVGLLVNGQSYVQTELLKLLPINLGQQKDLTLTLFTAKSLGIQMFTYKDIIFIESSGIQKLSNNLSVSWDNKNKAVIIHTGLALQN